MSNLTLSQINAAVEEAFQTAQTQSPAQRVPTHQIGENAVLRTDLYTGPNGTGFVVVATVDLKFRTLVIAKQSGPETARNQESPTLENLLLECQKARAKRYGAEASIYDLADAETKLASSNAGLQAEGATQKTAVLAKRLQIKTDLPKPE